MGITDILAGGRLKNKECLHSNRSEKINLEEEARSENINYKTRYVFDYGKLLRSKFKLFFNFKKKIKKILVGKFFCNVISSKYKVIFDIKS